MRGGSGAALAAHLACVELTDNDVDIITAPKRVWDTKNRLLASIDRARSVLGYEPQVDFDDGLNRTIDWFRAMWDNIERDAEFPPGMSSATRGVSANASLVKS